MTDDISFFFCKMGIGHDGFLSGVFVGRASYTTRKPRHVHYLPQVVHLQLEFTQQHLNNSRCPYFFHSQKENVLLEDIFVYPEMAKYDDLKKYEKKESSKKVIKDFYDYSKILIAGEDQSGKTTLCKKIFLELRKKNFVPVYVADKNNKYLGKIENKIAKAYLEQYEDVQLKEIDKERIVPIIDEFHFAKHKESNIQDLSVYCHQIVIVDDIFGLNFKDENLIKSFTHFKIKEFTPSLRNELIMKWTHLTDKKSNAAQGENSKYQNIDHTTELVNTALGKIIGRGIMPAYPFFILSVISTYETFEKPLDQEITSQGYCYQALIYMYLRKQGIKNDEIDTYINFLTEFAFYFHNENKYELSMHDFVTFMEFYVNKYNLPIKSEILLGNLEETKMISLDNCNNYSFCYPYLYYFFVAKYLAEHMDDNKKTIDSIISNLHKNENAYIAIFISHHSKKNYILDEILLNAMSLFDNYEPAKLSKEELSFFDEQVNIIAKAVLPSADKTPEIERDSRLKAQDEVEQNNKNIETNSDTDEGDGLDKELRRSIKTVEVMGRIIKNRAGSLEKGVLENVFEEGMKVHLKIIMSFLEFIKDEKHQQAVVDFISKRLDLIIKDKEKRPSQDRLLKMSKSIFWNTNFSIIYAFIDKIMHSLGSNKLATVVEKVCDKENTPASFLVKHGIFMWYNKNLQIDNIADRIDEDGFSETAKNIMNFQIVNHCAVHSIGFKERQKIEFRLKIPSNKLLAVGYEKASDSDD